MRACACSVCGAVRGQRQCWSPTGTAAATAAVAHHPSGHTFAAGGLRDVCSRLSSRPGSAGAGCAARLHAGRQAGASTHASAMAVQWHHPLRPWRASPKQKHPHNTRGSVLCVQLRSPPGRESCEHARTVVVAQHLRRLVRRGRELLTPLGCEARVMWVLVRRAQRVSV
jgi:hypothetical protein